MGAIETGRPEAAAAIWNWRGSETESERSSLPGRIRMLGSLQAIGAGVVGGLLYTFWSPIVGTLVLSVAALIGLAALASPGALYPAIRGVFSTLGTWTGRALTWILMVPIFYGFFLPFGRLLRRGRRDRLRRRLDPDAPSYWEPHEGIRASSASRLRQY